MTKKEDKDKDKIEQVSMENINIPKTEIEYVTMETVPTPDYSYGVDAEPLNYEYAVRNKPNNRRNIYLS